jgi:hypothetical protein
VKSVITLSILLTMTVFTTSLMLDEAYAPPPTTPPGGGPTCPPACPPPPPPPPPPPQQNQMTLIDPTLTYSTAESTVTASGTLQTKVGQAPITNGQCLTGTNTCEITASTELTYDQDVSTSLGYGKDIVANGENVINPNYASLDQTGGAVTFTDEEIHVAPPGLQNIATSTYTDSYAQAYEGSESYSCGSEISCPGALVQGETLDNQYAFSFELDANGNPELTSSTSTTPDITYTNENFNGPNENSGFVLEPNGAPTTSDPYNVAFNEEETSFTLTEHPAQPFNTQTFTDVDTVIEP